MNKVFIPIFFLILASCAHKNEIKFSQLDSVQTSYQTDSPDIKKAYSELRVKAAKISCEALGNCENESSALKYVKKTSVKKTVNGASSFVFSGRHKFATSEFIKTSSGLKDLTPSIKLYANFFSPDDNSFKYFSNGLNLNCVAGFCVKVSSEIFNFPSLNAFDYVAQSDVYSYYINNEINGSFTAISSSTVRLYWGGEKKQIEAFVIEESATAFNKEEAVEKAMSACASKAEKKIFESAQKHAASLKYRTIIFAGVKDMNSLKRVRKILSDSGFKPFFLKSYVKEEAVFSVWAFEMINEELVSRIMKTPESFLNIEYIDKNEVKFFVGENVISSEN